MVLLSEVVIGLVIIIPSKEEPTLLSGPCRSYEIIVIQKTLDTLIQQFESGSSTLTDTVIFSDSLSAIGWVKTDMKHH